MPHDFAVGKTGLVAKRFPFKTKEAKLWKSMDPLLKLLRQDARIPLAQLSRMLGATEEEIQKRIQQYETEHVILGYQAILNEEKLGVDQVRALIEVKITPQREGGFDRIAQRIARFQEVQSCYLMSGAYDLLVEVVGNDVKEVALFVAEKLATIEGVISTATHFVLKPYKERGFLTMPEEPNEKLPVSP